MDEYTLQPINANEITKVEVLPQLKSIQRLIVRTCSYFFEGNLIMDNPPFKGFILCGPPGTGKTELVKQSTLRLNKQLAQVYDVTFLLIDGASIAAPKWGDAEKKLKSIFNLINSTDKKTILLFDDIESLMLTRGTSLAKEWHYSINSILFHELDKLNPNNCMIFATTNRPDLVDDAIKTRLYPIKIPNPPLEQLMQVVDEILMSSYMDTLKRDKIRGDIEEKLKNMTSPTIRDARHITVVECIERDAWSV